METFLLSLFITIVVITMFIYGYAWITWDIPLIREYTKLIKWIMIVFIIILIIGLFIDGSLFKDLRDWTKTWR